MPGAAVQHTGAAAAIISGACGLDGREPDQFRPNRFDRRVCRRRWGRGSWWSRSPWRMMAKCARMSPISLRSWFSMLFSLYPSYSSHGAFSYVMHYGAVSYLLHYGAFSYVVVCRRS